MVWVYDPAFALLVEDRAVAVVEQGHCVFFTTRSILGGGAPGQQCDNERVGVFAELPGVVDDASELAVVMLLVVGDPDTLRKESGVVRKVECAGEKSPLPLKCW